MLTSLLLFSVISQPCYVFDRLLVGLPQCTDDFEHNSHRLCLQKANVTGFRDFSSLSKLPYRSDENGIYALHHKNKRDYGPPNPIFGQTSTQDSFVCESCTCMSLDVFIFDLDTLSPHTHTSIDRLTDVLSLSTGTTSDYIHIPLSPTTDSTYICVDLRGSIFFQSIFLWLQDVKMFKKYTITTATHQISLACSPSYCWPRTEPRARSESWTSFRRQHYRWISLWYL